MNLMKHFIFPLFAASCMLFACNAPADAPEAVVQGKAVKTGLKDGNYVINKVKPRVTWAASKLTGDGHDGTLHIESGKFKLQNGEIAGGKVIFDMQRIEVTDLTGEDKASLEGHLRSGDFFNVEIHPKATLAVNSVAESDGKKSLNATLTLNGKAVDYVIPVEIDGAVTDVYVLKRPWVDYFMERAGERWEVVVYTASLAKYADPLLDLLDKKTGIIRHRLFRESCYPFQGNYVKDLTSLGREMTRCVIVDNSPHSYAFQPQNALPVASFIDDPRDNDLLDLLPYLDELAEAKDVTETLVRNDGFVPRRTFHSRGLPVPHHRRYQ